jgi:hypothetical protein
LDNSTIQGLDGFLQFLSDSPKKVQDGLHVGLLAGAQMIEAQAKANCPVAPPNSENAQLYHDYYGALRDSIRVVMTEKNGQTVAYIRAGGKAPSGADVYYAHLIEFTGAAPHVIKGRNGRPITFNGRSYESIHHPGFAPHPFLRPALDANEVAAIGLLDQGIEAALKS